jgi:hypothetical protein
MGGLYNGRAQDEDRKKRWGLGAPGAVMLGHRWRWVNATQRSSLGCLLPEREYTPNDAKSNSIGHACPLSVVVVIGLRLYFIYCPLFIFIFYNLRFLDDHHVMDQWWWSCL